MADSKSQPTPLVAVTRGAQVESVHRGSVAMVRADGEMVAQAGDVVSPVFPRSAIKAMQVLPFVASGGADRLGFSDAEIAIACASHKGETFHADQALQTLSRLELDADALKCGAHWPSGPAAYRELVQSAGEPGKQHNNCSGKHVAMLAAARDLGVAVGDYTAPDHPVQRRVRETLETLCSVDLAAVHPGVDGCGAPNWPIPLKSLAMGFARFATGSAVASNQADAARRILEACWRHSDLVSGTEGLDTAALRLGGKRVFLKTGAEGVYCGALPALGLGFALKIEDGALRASEFAVLSLITAYHPDFETLLSPRQKIQNWAGDLVGRIQPTKEFAEFIGMLARNQA